MSLVAVALSVAALGVVMVLAFRLLAPSPDTSDGDAFVLERLRKAGSNLEKPHKVEFFLYVPTEAAAAQLMSDLKAMKLNAEIRPAAAGERYAPEVRSATCYCAGRKYMVIG